MNLNTRIQGWVEAKIIDQSQASQIIKYEETQLRPSWIIFGVSALGVLAIMTGLISIIAANWDDISDFTKLAGYFVSLLLLGVLTQKQQDKKGVIRECLLCAFSVYILAGIGLIGQIYHLKSDGYQALFFWLAITLPITVTTEKSLVNHLWCLGLCIAVTIWDFTRNSTLLSTSYSPNPLYYKHYITTALPFLFLGLSYLFDPLPSPQFCRVLRLWSYFVLLLIFSILGNIAYAEHYSTETTDILNGPWFTFTLAAVILALTGTFFRKVHPGKVVTIAISTTIIATALLTLVPLAYHFGHHEILGCFLFLLAWAGASATAASTNNKRLFDFATLILGIRFVVVYFEVFGSLAATGIGLLFSGGAILGCAYMWHHYRGTVASAIQEKI
jgi:uncharacterized membrane protein